VYTIQKETSKGKTTTLHRNLLLPIGHFENYKTTTEESISKPQRPISRPRTRQTVKEKIQIQEGTGHRDDTEDDSYGEKFEMASLYRGQSKIKRKIINLEGNQRCQEK
jgi:hypothetical protein